MISEEQMKILSDNLEHIDFDGKYVIAKIDDQIIFKLPFNYSLEVELDRHINSNNKTVMFYESIVDKYRALSHQLGVVKDAVEESENI